MSAPFFDLPAESFPITLRAFRESDGEEVWTAVVEEPAALYVPPLALQHGKVRIRVEYGDGSVADA
jgi:hypothetical protein